MYSHQPFHLGGAWLPLMIIIALLIIAFEVWMIVDAALNKQLSDKEKALWIVGMVLIHPFVAIAYFFIGRRKV